METVKVRVWLDGTNQEFEPNIAPHSFMSDDYEVREAPICKKCGVMDVE